MRGATFETGAAMYAQSQNHRSIVRIVRQIAAMVLVCSTLFGNMAVAATPAAAAPPDSIYWGAYLAGGPPWNTAAVEQFEAQVGKKESIVHWAEPWLYN